MRRAWQADVGVVQYQLGRVAEGLERRPDVVEAHAFGRRARVLGPARKLGEMSHQAAAVDLAAEFGKQRAQSHEGASPGTARFRCARQGARVSARARRYATHGSGRRVSIILQTSSCAVNSPMMAFVAQSVIF